MNQQTSEMDDQNKPPAPVPIVEQLTKLTNTRRATTKSQLINQLRHNTRWNLSSRKYSKELLMAVFNQLTRPIQLTFLWLHWNKLQSVCKMVVEPQYVKLKIMNLGGNKIISVQPLQYAHMPALEQLWMWSNHLTRVDCLRKMYTPNLKYIDLSSNFIVEWSRISELHSTKLQIISINYNAFGCIDNFAKLLVSSSSQKIINFMGNDVLRVFGVQNKKVRRDGKVKAGKNYHFPAHKVEYT